MSFVCLGRNGKTKANTVLEKEACSPVVRLDFMCNTNDLCDPKQSAWLAKLHLFHFHVKHHYRSCRG